MESWALLAGTGLNWTNYCGHSEDGPTRRSVPEEERLNLGGRHRSARAFHWECKGSPLELSGSGGRT